MRGVWMPASRNGVYVEHSWLDDYTIYREPRKSPPALATLSLATCLRLRRATVSMCHAFKTDDGGGDVFNEFNH